MAVNTITVQKGNVTRPIQAAALKTYERKGWKQVGGQSSETVMVATVIKKNDVGPVDQVGGADTDAEAEVSTTSGSPFVPVDQPDETTDTTESVAPDLEALREEYKILAGKDAAKKWNENRLKTEIAKLSPQ
jgi:hypothetical protein